MNQWTSVISVAIVIIMIIWLIYTMNITTYEDYITGFWIGDTDFCDSTGVSDILVWFDEPSGFRSTRSCYLVINPDIANCAFELKYWRGWGGPSIGTYHLRAECTFPEFSEDPPFPSEISIDVDMVCGQMRIYHQDKVYAKLTKSHGLTNIAAAEAE